MRVTELVHTPFFVFLEHLRGLNCVPVLSFASGLLSTLRYVVSHGGDGVIAGWVERPNRVFAVITLHRMDVQYPTTNVNVIPG